MSIRDTIGVYDTAEFAENPEARCPIVLALDISASMRGVRMETVNQALVKFRDIIREDPVTALRADVAIITFAREAWVDQDFTNGADFEPPVLVADSGFNAYSGTNYSRAVNLTLDITEARKQSYRDGGIAYYRSLAYFLTDGEPEHDTKGNDMDLQHRAIVMHSINRTVKMLDLLPARPDIVSTYEAFQIMDNAAIAHLAIEKALKNLILASGGENRKEHGLLSRYNALKRVNMPVADFLSEAYYDALSLYGYNPNIPRMKHMRSLDLYFSRTGGEKDFQAMRYWTLDQSTNTELLSLICLPMHREILCALHEAHRSEGIPRKKAADRVEDAIQYAFSLSIQALPSEQCNDYIRWWLNDHPTRRDALEHAVQSNFAIKDKPFNQALRDVYLRLAQNDDPAVVITMQHLQVLPPQPRVSGQEASVEWLGNQPEKSFGMVQSPAGTPIGEIAKRDDSLWNIFPLHEGMEVRARGIAKSHTDAARHLSQVMSREVLVIANGTQQVKRLVGTRDLPHDAYGARISEDDDGRGHPTLHFDFWEDNHGLTVGQHITIEGMHPHQGVGHIVEGTVTQVDNQKVSVEGCIATVAEKELTHCGKEE